MMYWKVVQCSSKKLLAIKKIAFELFQSTTIQHGNRNIKRKNKGLMVFYSLVALLMFPFVQNANAEWATAYDNMANPGSFLFGGDIAIDPNTPNTLYMSHDNLLSSVIEGSGDPYETYNLKTTDGGENWNAIGTGLVHVNNYTGESTPAITTVFAIHPTDSNIIYAGAGSGIYISTDAGLNWQNRSQGLGYIRDLVIDPVNPDIMYTILDMHHDRDFDGEWVDIYDDVYAVFKSTDGGVNWNYTGLKFHNYDYNTDIFCDAGLDQIFYKLTIDPENPSIVYLGTAYGVIKSTDGFTSWTTLPNSQFESYVTNQCNYHLPARVFNVVIDPVTSTTLYMATLDGVFKSTDSGLNWSQIAFDNTSIRDLVIDPTDPDKLYVIAAGSEVANFTSGIWRSTDGGDNWIPFYVGEPGFIFIAQHLNINPAIPSMLYAAYTDLGYHEDIGSLLENFEIASSAVIKYTIDNPNGLEFTDLNYLDLSTQVTSETMTVTNLAASTTISITGGEYSLNGGAFTSAAGPISNDDKVQLRTTSSANAITSVDVTVILESGGGDTWTVITAPDTTPDAFSFSDHTDLATHVEVTSNTVTISGLGDFDSGIVTVTDGSYSINGEAYTSGGSYIKNGDTLTVRHTSSSTNNESVVTTLSIGEFSTTLTSTTGDIDNTPNYFSFTSVENVDPSETITSNSILVSGINTPTSISSTGGYYIINGCSGVCNTVVAGDTVTVRLSESSYDRTATATLTIGNISANFSITTRSRDSVPDSFGFGSINDAEFNTYYSSYINVSGLLDPASISSSGNYSVNGISGVDTVNNGDKVTVGLTSSANYGSTVGTSVTIGGVTGTFNVTTPIDTVPDAFSFADQTAVELNTLITSDPVIMSGLDGPNALAPITIVGGEYSINDGPYTSEAGSVTNIDTVAVRTTSAATNDTTVDVIVTIGGLSDTFSITTLEDIIPDAFSFIDQSDVALDLLITSDTITMAGLGTSSPILITGGEYSINGGDYTSLEGLIDNGDTVNVRTTSSVTGSTAVDVVLTIGGNSDTFTVTTELDTDGDGIVNSLDPNDDNDGYDDVDDNCTLASNDQLDTDGDGYGNACDSDFNGDNIVNALDIGLFKEAFFSLGVQDTDLNGDGVINSLDLGLFKQMFFQPPGPSGLVE